MTAVLTSRALNRATLARQLLLERVPLDPVAAVERLAGMQAQEPKPPFLGLWSRVERFDAARLHEALLARELVRGPLMRATLHTVSAADYAAWRPLLAPVLAAAADGVIKTRRATVDLDAVLPVARELLAERPRPFDELRAALAEAFPEQPDERAPGYAVRMRLPLLMVPGDDRWAFPTAAAFGLAEQWLELAPAGGDLAPLARRYLAAFGPATAADLQTWCGLPRLAPLLDVLRDELVAFADEQGRELLDLPDAPRPDPDAAAPPRFLPEFDNLLLSHVDRTRIIADEHRPHVFTKNLRVRATFTLDGFVAGTWTHKRTKRKATLTLSPFADLPKKAEAALREEGEALLRFLEPDAPEVAFAVATR